MKLSSDVHTVSLFYDKKGRSIRIRIETKHMIAMVKEVDKIKKEDPLE